MKRIRVHILRLIVKAKRCLKRLINRGLDSLNSFLSRRVASHFKTLSELLHYAIMNNDQSLSNSLLSFLSQQFDEYATSNNNSDGVKFPQEYYDLITETNGLVCDAKYRNFFYLETTNIYNIPLQYVYVSNSLISKETFQILWKCLIQYDMQKEYTLFLSYWNFTYQYNENTWEDQPNLLRFNECVAALLMARKQYEILYEIIYWFYETPKKVDFFRFPIRWRVFRSSVEMDLVVTNNKEEILLRYLRFVDYIKSVNFTIPNVASTKDMKNPIAEYGKRFFILLYLIAKQKDKYDFYISQTDDLDLPPDMMKEGIINIFKDFDETMSIVLSDNTLLTRFMIMNNKEDIATLSTNAFVEQVCDRLKFKSRLSDINAEDIQRLDEKTKSGCENALNFIHQELGFVNKKRYWKDSIHNDNFFTYAVYNKEYCAKNKKETKQIDYKDIYDRCYCNLVDQCLLAFQNDVDAKKSVATTTELLSMLDEEIKHSVRTKSNYIIVIDRSYGRDILRGKTEEKEGKTYYSGIEVIIVPINRSSAKTCNVWLIRKEDIPYCYIRKTEPDLFLGYRFTKIFKKPAIFRLMLDIGRTPDEVIKDLRKYFSIDRSKDITDLVLNCVFVPIEIGCKKENKFKWFELLNVPSNADDSYPDDYDYDDDFDPPEDPLAEAIITPEEQNKKSKQEEIKLLNKL